MRTPDQILTRITALNESRWDDMFGAQRMDLIGALTYDHAKPHLADSVTREGWENDDDDRRTYTDDAVRARALAYLVFAVGKAVDHRGLSASRSLDHFRAWLWLILDDDTYAGWERVADTEYAQYGAPALSDAAGLLDPSGATWAAFTEQYGEPLARMAAGDPCEPDCNQGCAA